MLLILFWCYTSSCSRAQERLNGAVFILFPSQSDLVNSRSSFSDEAKSLRRPFVFFFNTPYSQAKPNSLLDGSPKSYRHLCNLTQVLNVWVVVEYWANKFFLHLAVWCMTVSISHDYSYETREYMLNEWRGGWLDEWRGWWMNFLKRGMNRLFFWEISSLGPTTRVSWYCRAWRASEISLPEGCLYEKRSWREKQSSF